MINTKKYISCFLSFTLFMTMLSPFSFAGEKDSLKTLTKMQGSALSKKIQSAKEKAEKCEIDESALKGLSETQQLAHIVHHVLHVCKMAELNKIKESEDSLYALAEAASVGDFTQEQVNNLTGFVFYHLRQYPASESLQIITGALIRNKKFSMLRERLAFSLGNPSSDNDFVEPYLLAVREAGSLAFFNKEEQENIIKRANSFLAQKAQELSTGKDNGRVSNEALAARVFMDATSFFSSKEGDGFFKGLITAAVPSGVIPIKDPPPGRDKSGNFLNNQSGKWHKASFFVIEMLMQHYVLTGQHDKVENFIIDQSLRQGNYYMQFASDGMSIATYYYSQESEAVFSQWQDRQEKIVKRIKKEAPFKLKAIVNASLISQVALEWVVVAGVFKFAFKFVLTPIAKGALSLLPRTFKIRVLKVFFKNKIWIREHAVAFFGKTSQTLKNLKGKFVRTSGAGALKTTANNMVAKRLPRLSSFLKDPIEKLPSYLLDFAKKTEVQVLDAETSAYLFKGGKHKVLSRIELESFYTRMEAAKKVSGISSPETTRLFVRGGEYIPGLETYLYSNNIGRTLSLIQSATKNSKLVSMKVEKSGVRNIITENAKGVRVRFGQHEIKSAVSHIHIEQVKTKEGVTYFLNQSIPLNTKEALRSILSGNKEVLWRMMTKKETQIFLEAAKTPGKIHSEKGRTYFSLVYDYIYGAGDKAALERKMINLISQQGPKVSFEEAYEQMIKRAINSTTHAEFASLSSVVEARFSSMATEEASALLEWIILQNTKGGVTFGSFDTYLHYTGRALLKSEATSGNLAPAR